MSNPFEIDFANTAYGSKETVDVAIYDETTGEWTGKTYTGSESDVALNIPAGAVAMPRAAKPHLKKLKDGKLIDHRPDPPGRSEDHQWNTDNEEWELTVAAQKIKIDDEVARATIDSLERQQARALRELALDSKNKAAVDSLKAIDDSIIESRKKLLPTTPPAEGA